MPQLNNKIKAFILLLVFALNTIVSFACSVGLINLQKGHHHQASSSSHSHDKPHSHESDNKAHSHEDIVSSKHTHEKGAHQHEHKEDGKTCCSDEVIKIAETDKTLTKTGSIPQPVSVELLATIYTFILGEHYRAVSLIKPAPPFVRSWHPTTISDLRIVIQSFQI